MLPFCLHIYNEFSLGRPDTGTNSQSALCPIFNKYKHLSMITKEQKELFRKKIGKLLEQRRLEKGLNRGELGERLGYEGNSAIQVVAGFESGRAGVPKTKIEKLLKILELKNEDFGLSGSKSLKNFITASGFLGSTMAPWSDAMVGFLEGTEQFRKADPLRGRGWRRIANRRPNRPISRCNSYYAALSSPTTGDTTEPFGTVGFA